MPLWSRIRTFVTHFERLLRGKSDAWKCSWLLLFSNRSDIPTKGKITEFLPGFPDNIWGYLSTQIKNTFSFPLHCDNFLSKFGACQGWCEHHLDIINKIKQIMCIYSPQPRETVQPSQGLHSKIDGILQYRSKAKIDYHHNIPEIFYISIIRSHW